MRKNNKVLLGLLIVVLLAVIGLSAYAYQKQKALNNIKPKVTQTKKDESKFDKIIKESSSNFNKENDLNKKIEILKSLLSNKEDIEKENKDKLTSDYNKLVKEMREKLQSNLKDKISSLTINNDDKNNSEKIDSVKKELSELQTLVEKEKETIFEKDEEFSEISQLIKTNLSTTEVTQTPTTNNSTNEQAQHTEVVEVPATQRARGTVNYTPPRVQNNPTTNSSPQVAPNNTATPTVASPVESSTTGTSGTSE
ncbi:hypothetical protein [Gemella haemolysans]|uniref:hypothetical protein n=1 Tax=Gemella haemolysans TaxID=1379 RepID=UPI0019588F8F|nr:hypothetical protein [Gemella haemolysans]VTX83909.1 Uncharacterised protein [Gemella haemolysans]